VNEYGILWTMADAAKALGCSRQKLYRLYDAGVIKLVKFGAHTRVPDGSLRALMSGDSLPELKLRRSYGKSASKRATGP
jgi:excisionase family DNA binding protein